MTAAPGPQQPNEVRAVWPDDREWAPDNEVTCLYCQRYKNRKVCRCGDPNPPDRDTGEGRPDAYVYLGPIQGDHMATECGLRVDTPDDELEEIAAKVLDDPEPCPFDPATLGPALVTWRDDLGYLAELDEVDAEEGVGE